LSSKEGRGAEHQFPHLYSQVGVGETVTVDVQKDAVVFAVEVVGGGEFEVVLIGVEVVQDLELVELELEPAKLVLLEVLMRDDVLDELIDDDVEDKVVMMMSEDTGGKTPQGSVDSMSLATYRLRAALPPHWMIRELAIASLGQMWG
jgi:hypothetical protein